MNERKTTGRLHHTVKSVTKYHGITKTIITQSQKRIFPSGSLTMPNFLRARASLCFYCEKQF